MFLRRIVFEVSQLRKRRLQVGAKAQKDVECRFLHERTIDGGPQNLASITLQMFLDLGEETGRRGNVERSDLLLLTDLHDASHDHLRKVREPVILRMVLVPYPDRTAAGTRFRGLTIGMREFLGSQWFLLGDRVSADINEPAVVRIAHDEERWNVDIGHGIGELGGVSHERGKE